MRNWKAVEEPTVDELNSAIANGATGLYLPSFLDKDRVMIGKPPAWEQKVIMGFLKQKILTQSPVLSLEEAVDWQLRQQRKITLALYPCGPSWDEARDILLNACNTLADTEARVVYFPPEYLENALFSFIGSRYRFDRHKFAPSRGITIKYEGYEVDLLGKAKKCSAEYVIVSGEGRYFRERLEKIESIYHKFVIDCRKIKARDLEEIGRELADSDHILLLP